MSFFSARDARKQATGLRAVFDEIALIQPAVLDAIDNGNFEVKVGPIMDIETGMTNSATHFNAYVDPQNNQDDASQVARQQLYRVIGHFVELGYTVRIEKHEDTETFNWIIKW